jgi:hypothetical protein
MAGKYHHTATEQNQYPIAILCWTAPDYRHNVSLKKEIDPGKNLSQVWHFWLLHVQKDKQPISPSRPPN